VARRVGVIIAAAVAWATADAGVHRLPHRRKVASLLGKRWDWKTASDEAITEWAIELRRYNMVDMELNDMVVRLSLVLPIDPTTGEARPNPDQSEVEHMRKKANKIQSELDGAASSQHVADETFADMEGDTQFTLKDKQKLSDEHSKELLKFQDLARSGHEALHQALAILKLFDKAALAPAQAQTSDFPGRAPAARQAAGTHPKVNATVGIGNTNLVSAFATRAAASPIVQMYNHFKEASDAFSAKRGQFVRETRESKAQLLAVRSRLSKVELHED